MQIGRKDVAWNFAATSLRIASGIIVMPFSLHLLSNQDIGLWGIFLTIGTLTTLLDFGFSNSFSRNITYIFSGAKELKAEGFTAVNREDTSIDYGLLKSVIAAMRRYYGLLSLIFLVIFLIGSPFYMNILLDKYTGNKTNVIVAWIIYGALLSYQLYTYYYGSLLIGRGYIKRSYQITIISQCVQIVAIMTFLLLKMGLLSMAMGLFLSVVVGRIFSYFAFFDTDLKHNLKISTAQSVSKTMRILAPNSIKIGFTSIGGFLTSKMSMIIAPLLLPLSDIGSFSITRQMIDVIVSIGAIWFSTFYPQIIQYRVNGDNAGVKRLYIKGQLCLISVFIICGLGLIYVGPPALELIKSKTHLLTSGMIVLFLVAIFFESNQGMSQNVLLTKNEVPFAKATIITGFVSLVVLYIFLKYTALGLWGMILAPAIVQAVYQNWKWTFQVIKELKITINDYKTVIMTLISVYLKQSKYF